MRKPRALVPAPVARPREDEAVATGRNDGRRHVRDPEVGAGAYVRDLGISAVSDAGAHHPTAIVTENVVGQYLRYGVPVAGCKAGREALVNLACRVFQLRRRTAELVEFRERGVDVLPRRTSRCG